jgi:hypothetical protein
MDGTSSQAQYDCLGSHLQSCRQVNAHQMAILLLQRPEDMSQENWENVFKTNVDGVFYAATAVGGCHGRLQGWHAQWQCSFFSLLVCPKQHESMQRSMLLQCLNHSMLLLHLQAYPYMKVCWTMLKDCSFDMHEACSCLNTH